ncbi:MAG: Uma2 family endonuclease [Lachnospiraceae bacterium]|nr:Uma2 family endonuclease [Lachnospiraceae bacterium]
MRKDPEEVRPDAAVSFHDNNCGLPENNVDNGSFDKSGPNIDDATCTKTHRVRYPDNPPDTEATRLREPEVAYGHRKQQGEYTLEYYYSLPDDMRVELIDGVIYDMSAPTFAHQSVAADLCVAFATYIRSKHGSCKAVPGPVDVQLDRDDRTMVQPDVVILCNKDKLRNGVIFGAPDLVVEVLSPSTGKKDRTVKLRKYREAGVREYWIIDMKRKEVEVYVFQNPELATLPKVYKFDSVIPVGIYGGDCKVDFSEISRDIWDM